MKKGRDIAESTAAYTGINGKVFALIKVMIDYLISIVVKFSKKGNFAFFYIFY